MSTAVEERIRGASETRRSFKIDNIRFILILLVVFGHLSEGVSGGFAKSLYNVIYCFHMPCFIFLTGYFAKFSPKTFIRRLAIPYVVFQTLYLIFDHLVIHPQEELFLQFGTPYWLLWYLMTAMWYNMLVPIIHTKSKRTAAIVLAVSVAIALLSGYDRAPVYDEGAGYFLSASRTLAFVPFFVGGYYCATVFSQDFMTALRRHRRSLPVISAAGIVITEVIILRLRVPAVVLFCAAGYDAVGGDPIIRLVMQLCALSWLTFLLCTVSDRKIPFITSAGQRTMAVYLLHGFVQRLIVKYRLLHFSAAVNLLLALLMAAAILAVFSAKPIHRLFRKLF
ncbi:MAG: acyltransferase family protein [Oscillospiraceae bacterium]|nr:acyltransferase family protein [Oscillospiraceae bacterium]